MPSPNQMFEPPLLRFMRALNQDEKEQFAEAIGTTVQYVHQMSTQPRPNPNLTMALAIEAESHRLSRQLGIEPLTLADLLVGRIMAKHVQDHTTGEVFTLLPSGEMARRRIDKKSRVVLIDARGRVIAVEDSNPGLPTLRKVLPLGDE